MLQSMGSQRVRYDLATEHDHHRYIYIYKHSNTKLNLRVLLKQFSNIFVLAMFLFKVNKISLLFQVKLIVVKSISAESQF